MKNVNNRRSFLKQSALIGAGFLAAPLLATSQTQYREDSMYIIGPREGYSPEIGTLLSTMTMMRTWMTNTAKDLSVEELDFLIDDQANSIGAMLLHLAATEKYYQLHTFDEMKWGEWPQEIKEKWDAPMNLGDAGREQIKGNPYSYYEDALNEVRETTKKEFAKRDDDWLMAVDEDWYWGPTNNYCKWFHVCEHESNHNGQMKFVKKRLPK